MIGRFRMRLDPPPGSKRISDWKGQVVVTVEPMRNGSYELPAGTEAFVEGCGGGTGLQLKTSPCKCCGVSVFISRVHSSNVKVKAS